jgi:DNA-binding MarR family transcriptional regulator
VSRRSAVAAKQQSAAPHSVRGGTLAPSIVVRLLATHNLMIAALRRGLGPEVTLARFDLLAQLVRENGATLATLSRRMLVTAGNLTGLVDRAERDGLVERRADPSDRRLTRVFLTPKGDKLATKVVAAHNALAEELLAPLGHDEQHALRESLGHLRAALEARGGGVGTASTEDTGEGPGGSR